METELSPFAWKDEYDSGYEDGSWKAGYNPPVEKNRRIAYDLGYYYAKTRYGNE